MSIASMKKELAKLNEEFIKTRQSYRKDPEVIRTKKAYDKAVTKAQNKSDEKATPIAARSQKLRAELAVAEEAARQSIPERLADIITRCLSGVDYGPKGLIVEWVSPSERFAIILQPGHTFWANMMEPNKYASAERTLLDAERDSQSTHAMDLYRDVMVKSHEGRFTKAVRQEWMDYIEEQEA